MNGDQIVGTFAIALMMVLVVSSLIARRLSAAHYVRMAATWVLIWASAVALVLLLQRAGVPLPGRR
jgi:Na+-driven multidrug efflux pump